MDNQPWIIIQYHDKSCFHTNDKARSLWLQEGEQPLWKKSQVRLIHISDFINEKDGHLVLLDKDGNILCDAQKIIYFGSNGDPWWDTEQLMAQIRSAIEIFKAAHHNCQALFIFDQSSAHALLPPDALRAFKMINLMVESSTCNMTPPFPNQILILVSVVNINQWPLPLVKPKVCRLCLKSVVLMFPEPGPSAHLCALSRAKIVAWPNFSLSKEISVIKAQCLRVLSRRRVTFVFSCPNFTVSWTQLKW